MECLCTCSSSCIHFFPTVLLPLSFAMLLAPWSIYSSKIVRYYQSLESYFDPFLLLLHQVEDKQHKNRRLNLAVSVSNMNNTGRFWKSVPTRTTRCCPFRELCDVLDSSLNFMEFSGFPRSSRKDFVREPFLHFPTTSWILSIRSSSFKITSCAIPSSRRSI